MVLPSSNNSNNTNNNIPNIPDPNKQEPKWGIYDYMAYSIKSFYEYLYTPANENSGPSEFTPLKEKDIVHTADNKKIPGHVALKTMQGIESKEDTDENEFFSLECSEEDEEFFSLEESSEEESEVTGGDSGSDQFKEGTKIMVLEGILKAMKNENEELTRRIQELETAAREKIEAPHSNESPTTESSSTESVSTTPKPKVEEKKIVVSDKLRSILKERIPNVQPVDVLFNKPTANLPAVNVISSDRTGKTAGQAGRGAGRGGPAAKVDRTDKSAVDAVLAKKLGISREELDIRREAFPIVLQELVDLISKEPEITLIKEQHKATLAKASNFISKKNENLQKLTLIKKELEKAKAEYASFSQLLKEYEVLNEVNPEAASKMKMEFTHKSTGEIKMESFDAILKKGLINAYRDDAVAAENNLKNFTQEMESLEQAYKGTLIYEIKGNAGREKKKIAAAEVIDLDNVINESKGILDKLKENMRIYGLNVARANKEVASELTPEEEATQAKIKEEKQEKMKLELQEKVGALKPDNVTNYAFRVKED